MKNEEIMSNLSEEVKQNLAACKTQAEMERVLADAGIEPMDDELLDAIAGGSRGPIPGRVPGQVVDCRSKSHR